MCSSAHQICDMWECNAQERGSERYREARKDKERERSSGRRRSAVSSGHAWIHFAHLPQSVRFYANTDTHTYTSCVCVWVFSCAYSTIVTDYLLSTCFGSHHLGTASSLGVELWRCTQLAAAAAAAATVRHVRHMPQNEASGKEGNGAGKRVQRVALSAWKMSFCHMGNVLAGTEQGRERAKREVVPWWGQLLDFPKHQTDYSLIKCAIAVLCCACEGSTGGGEPGAFSPFPNVATSLVFLAHGWQRPRSPCAWGQFCFWL